MEFWFVTGALCISAYYLVIPLVLRFQQKMAAHPSLRAMELHSLPPSVAQFLMTRTKKIFDLGFAEPTMIQTRAAANINTYLIVLVNRQTGDKAYVTCLVATSTLQNFSVEFSTRFDSGEVFDTHNVKDPLPFPPDPGHVRTQVPMLTDLGQLYEMHQFVMAKYPVRGQKVLFAPGEALDYVARYALQLPYEQKVARGWMYYDRKNDVYRPTLLGAYRLTWGLLQPFQTFRKMALKRTARRTLEEFSRARVVSTGSPALAAAQVFSGAQALFETACDHHAAEATGALPAEQNQALEQLEFAAAQVNRHAEHAQELAELETLQKARASWGSGILMLGASLVLFLTAGAASWSMRFALLLVPILLFHELGHFLAMRAFDYRNVRMFFIPFFGAAVTGRHYNVPGWKKAMVSLLGPLPGILLATVLGVVGILLEQKLLLEIAVLTLVLNGLNLLPILPLDGGWVLHAVLFSRHYLLDAAFRLLACALLVAGSLLVHDRVLTILAVFLLLALPTTYRLGRVAHRLRAKIPAASPDDQSIAPDTACLILDELKTALPTALPARQRAQYALQVFEAINTRPPGWLATLGLATVHLGSLLVAVGVSAVFVLAQHGSLRQVGWEAAHMPKQVVQPGNMLAWRGSGLREETWKPLTVGATFATDEQATAAFETCKRQVPGRCRLRLFGRTLLVELDGEDQPAHAEMMKRLEGAATDRFVHKQGQEVSLNLTCFAPNAEVAEAIVAEANQYLDFAREGLLIAPWSREHQLSEGQRKARKTRARLEHELAALDPAEVRELSMAIVQARQRGDKQELGTLLAKRRLVSEEIRRRYFEKLQQEAGDAIDLEVVDLYVERPEPPLATVADDGEPAKLLAERKKLLEERGKRLQEWHAQLARPMGQLPCLDGQNLPGADRFSCRAGATTRAALLVRFEFLLFVRTAEGAPALIDWLQNQGCIDFKYDFDSER